MNKNILDNYWIVVGVCLLISSLIALLAYNVNIPWLPALAVSYAIFKDIFLYLRGKEQKRTNDEERIKILKRFATDKIKSTRNLIRLKSTRPIVESFAHLEYIVTQVMLCCTDKDHNRRFRIVKGLIGSTKTTFDKSTIDENIVKPTEDAYNCINTIETYLNDL